MVKMKGIILHGGAGTRLRPLTFSGPKQLIPLANKPISQYVLENLVSSDVRDIAIILGETFSELVREHYGNGSKFGTHITYINQGKPLGIAHAINLCREFIGEDKFVVYLGDNLLQSGIKQYVEDFLSRDVDAMLLLKEMVDPRRFGVAKLDAKGNLVGLVEKPKEPPSNYVLVGVYFLTPLIFDMIDRLKPSWRGEYEVTEALQMLIEEGHKIESKIVDGWWLDTGKKDNILYANALILDEQIKRNVKGKLIKSRVEGRVTVEKGTKIIESIVRGPTIIGKNCLIKNSFIGPYMSINDNTQIINSNIEYCVILEGAIVDGVDRIGESLVGKYARIIKDGSNKKTFRVHVGDYSEIIL